MQNCEFRIAPYEWRGGWKRVGLVLRCRGEQRPRTNRQLGRGPGRGNSQRFDSIGYTEPETLDESFDISRLGTVLSQVVETDDTDATRGTHELGGSEVDPLDPRRMQLLEGLRQVSDHMCRFVFTEDRGQALAIGLCDHEVDSRRRLDLNEDSLLCGDTSRRRAFETQAGLRSHANVLHDYSVTRLTAELTPQVGRHDRPTTLTVPDTSDDAKPRTDDDAWLQLEWVQRGQLAERCRGRGAGHPRSVALSTSGTLNVKRAPFPCSFARWISPPHPLTSCLHTYKPTPVPCPLVV